MTVLSKRIPRILRSNGPVMVGSLVLVLLAAMSYTSIEALIGNMTANRARFARDYALESAAFVTQRSLPDPSSLATSLHVVLEPRREADVVVDGPNPYSLRLMEQTSLINRPAVTTGSPLGSDTDILLGQTIVQARGLPLEGTITAAGQPFHVVGAVTVPDYLYPLKDPEETSLLIDMKAFGIAVVTGAVLDTLEVPVRTVWHVIGTPANLVSLKYAVAASAGLVSWLDIAANPRYTIVDAEMKNARFAVASLPTLLLLLAALMLAIAMNRFIHRELPQIGMLLAQGYTAGELLRHYLLLPAFVAGTGSVLGVIAGFLFFGPLYRFYAAFFAVPLLHLEVRASWILLSILLPLAFLLPSVTFVVLRAVRRTPVELMKNRGERIQITALERHLTIRRLSAAGQFRVRDVVRSPARFIVTFIGITVAAAMLLAGQTLQNSITVMIDTTFNNIMRYDYQYVLRTLHTTNLWKGETAYVESFRGSDRGAPGLQLMGVDPSFSMIQAADASGTAVTFDKVVMTRSLADRWGVTPGDTVTIVRMATDRSYGIRVDSVAEIYINSAIFMPRDQMTALLGMPPHSFNVVYSSYPLSIADAELVSTTTKAEVRQGFESILTWARTMMGVIGGVGILISLFVVLVVASLNIDDHRITISTLKVLGYTNREIAGMVLLSTAVPLILGYALAVPFLTSYLHILLTLNQQNLDYSLPIRVSPSGVAFGLVIIVLAWGASTALAMRSVFRIPLADSLKASRE
ncbi:MAG: ABC transporter permease [Candidatus Cryosericum sp.]